MKASLLILSLAVPGAYAATEARPSDLSVAIRCTLPEKARQQMIVPEGYVQIGQPIAFQAVGGSSGTSVQTRYVLTDMSGKIVQVTADPVFSSAALSVGEYRIYAVAYTDDQTIQGLTADNTSLITEVTASCLALSAPLAVHVIDCAPVCVPVVAHKIR